MCMFDNSEWTSGGIFLGTNWRGRPYCSTWKIPVGGVEGGVGDGEKLKSTCQPQTLVVSRKKWIAVSLIFQYMSVEAHGLVWWGGEGANVAKILQVL